MSCRSKMNNSGQAGGKSRLSSLRSVVSEQQLLTSVNTESPIFIWPSGIVNVADNPGHDRFTGLLWPPITLFAAQHWPSGQVMLLASSADRLNFPRAVTAPQPFHWGVADAESSSVVRCRRTAGDRVKDLMKMSVSNSIVQSEDLFCIHRKLLVVRKVISTARVLGASKESHVRNNFGR